MLKFGMDLFSAALLGVVQGLTEFLPISSSAHLIIIQRLLPGFSQPGIYFDVFLHGGTLLAVLFYFRKTLLELVTLQNPHLMWILVIGTIPTAVVGFLFNDLFEAMFSSLLVTGITLIITGAMNWIVDVKKFKIQNSRQRRGSPKAAKFKINWLQALFIGIFQTIAIVPGISRSSATIFSAVVVGIDKKRAANYSFLLSIPAISGAIVLQSAKHGIAVADYTPYLIGFVFSAVVGYFSIGWLLKLLQQNKYKLFAFYCLVVGVIVSFLGAS